MKGAFGWRAPRISCKSQENVVQYLQFAELQRSDYRQR